MEVNQDPGMTFRWALRKRQQERDRERAERARARMSAGLSPPLESLDRVGA